VCKSLGWRRYARSMTFAPPLAPAAPPTTADRILEAATHLFAEQGISDTGMRGLAEAAGVSVPTLYNHFTNKRELVRAVFRRHGVTLEALDHPPLPTDMAGRLTVVAAAQLEVVRTRREIARLILRESATGNPEAHELSTELVEGWLATWRHVIGAAADVRDDIDLDLATEAVKCAVWGALSVSLTNDDFDVEASLRAIVSTMTAAFTGARAWPAAVPFSRPVEPPG
jgi:AcrR family transcriptional regulator